MIPVRGPRVPLLGRLSGRLEELGAVLLFAMMAVTFVDVFGRFLAGRPLAGSTEIVQMLLAVSTACLLPSVTWHQQHLGIGLFERARPTPLERVRRAVVGLVAAITFAVLAGLLWRHAGEARTNADVIGYLRLPVAPMIQAMSALCAVCAAVFGYLAVGAARGRPEPPPVRVAIGDDAGTGGGAAS